MAVVSWSESSSLTVASLADVRAWGWTPLRLAQELNDFRYRSIADLQANCQRAAEQWGTLYFDSADTWRILVTGPERIVGFWQIFSLNAESRDLLLAGRSTSHKPLSEVLRPMDRPGWYDVFIYSVSIESRFRNLHSAILLGNSMLAAVADLARRGILFRQVLATILTRDGMRVNHGLDFDLECVADHEIAGQIYAGHFPSILRRLIEKDGLEAVVRTLYELYFPPLGRVGPERGAACGNSPL